MKSIVLFAVAAGVPFVACVVNEVPPSDPSTIAVSSGPVSSAPPTATTTATASAATTATATAIATATATATASATATATATAPGSAAPGSPAAYQACAVDGDCVAVPKGGCCQNGRMEAVATSQTAAYKAAFACTQKVMCPMIMYNESRVAECSGTTHLCEMIAPETIQCGGTGASAHKCPTGYSCKSGTCAK
jgi:hypothetical protein